MYKTKCISILHYKLILGRWQLYLVSMTTGFIEPPVSIFIGFWHKNELIIEELFWTHCSGHNTVVYHYIITSNEITIRQRKWIKLKFLVPIHISRNWLHPNLIKIKNYSYILNQRWFDIQTKFNWHCWNIRASP